MIKVNKVSKNEFILALAIITFCVGDAAIGS